jgi:hypothetical protein
VSKKTRKPTLNTSQGEGINSSIIDKIIFVILCLLLLVVPNILKVVQLYNHSPAFGNSLESKMVADLYAYSKFVVLCFGAAIVGSLLIYKLAKNKFEGIQPNYINLPAAMLYITIIVSGVFAEFKSPSFLGLYSRYEGTLTYICFLVIFFAAANIVWNNKQANWIIYATYPFILLNSLMSVLWFYGINLLKYDFVVGLLLPDTGSGYGRFGDGSYLSNTISNPDYASGIGGTLALLFLTKAMFSSGLRQRLVNLFMSVAAFSIIISSLARSGLYSVIIVLPLVALIGVFSTYPLKKTFATLLTGLVLFGLITIVFAQHNPQIIERYKSIAQIDNLTKVRTELGDVSKHVAEAIEETGLFNARPVYAEETNSKLDDEFNLPPAGFTTLTGRVYIWQRTFDLILKKPLLGYGMDTLGYYFPQTELLKSANVGGAEVIIDKPHNLYLDIGFGSGLLALLAFLLLLLRHVWVNIKLFRSKVSDETRVILAVLFVGWCAFLCQGMVNDFNIATDLFFWIPFGVSVSMLKQNNTVKKIIFKVGY